jgi:hypothetical protein
LQDRKRKIAASDGKPFYMLWLWAGWQYPKGDFFVATTFANDYYHSRFLEQVGRRKKQATNA